jgi:hypothetical protein
MTFQNGEAVAVPAGRTGSVLTEDVRGGLAFFADKVKLLLLFPRRPGGSVFRKVGCNFVKIDCDVLPAFKSCDPELALTTKKSALIFGRECRCGCAIAAVWTEHVFSDSVRPEVRSALRTLSPSESGFVGWKERRYHWGWFLGRALINTSHWPKFHPFAVKADTHLKITGTRTCYGQAHRNSFFISNEFKLAPTVFDLAKFSY